MEGKRADISLRDEGSIILLTPETEQGRAWIEEYIPADAMRWGSAVVCEVRYVHAIIEGMQADGLEISV